MYIHTCTYIYKSAYILYIICTLIGIIYILSLHLLKFNSELTLKLVPLFYILFSFFLTWDNIWKKNHNYVAPTYYNSSLIDFLL